MRAHVLLALLFTLPACSITTLAQSPRHHAGSEHEDESAVDPVAAARVRVLQNETLSCPSEVLGTVDVHEEVKNEAQALAILQRRAAALGAEAVVGVEFHHGEGAHEATHLSGMAVRCQDLIRGREYYVIGDVNAAGEMGHDEEAFETLRARGHALGADLIIGIHFEHGEGEGQAPRLTGKAIRFHAMPSPILR